MLTIDRKQFSRALDLAASVVETRASIPIVTSLKATANGKFRIEATDLDTTATVEIDYLGEHASFCIPEPRRLRTAINVAGGNAVSLDVPDPEAEKLTLDIVSGQLKAGLLTYPADDHPGASAPAFEEFGVDIGQDVLAQIARVTPAISSEETRYYLNGVCIRHLGDWNYRFAATDGHILMMVDVPLPGAIGAIPDKTIMPRRWVNLMLKRFARSKEPVRFTYGPSIPRNVQGHDLNLTPGMRRVAMATDLDGIRFALHSKLIDGTYPDFEKVVPTVINGARVRRADLMQAINALSPLTDEKRPAVKMTFGADKIGLSLCTAIMGDSSFSIPSRHDVPDGNVIGFNTKFLLSIAQSLHGEEIHFGFNEWPGAVVMVDPADTTFKAVIMPVRV